MLHPDGRCRTAMDILTLAAMLYDAFAVPFDMAWRPEWSVVLFVGAMATAIVWTLDMLVNLNSGYYEDGILEMSRRRIVRRHLFSTPNCCMQTPPTQRREYRRILRGAGLIVVSFRVAWTDIVRQLSGNLFVYVVIGRYKAADIATTGLRSAFSLCSRSGGYEGSSRGARLDDPSCDGHLHDLYGGEEVGDSGPDSRRGPPGAAGTSTFGSPTTNCAMLTNLGLNLSTCVASRMCVRSHVACHNSIVSK